MSAPSGAGKPPGDSGNSGTSGNSGGTAELTARTSRLSMQGHDDDEDDDEDDYEDQEAPPDLMRKVEALKALHEKCLEIDVEYKRERIALESKYRELKKPHYVSQSKIISGEVDVPAEGPEPTSEGAEEEKMKGIPGYWAQALVNHPAIQDIVTDEDLPAMEALTDIQCTINPEYTSFTLTFAFAENDYFTNQTLVKSYTVSPDLLDEKSPTLTEHSTSEINWKPGKNLCVSEVKKKQKAKAGKNKGQVRTVTTEEPKQSFFQYFSEPIDEEEDDYDEDDEDEEKPKIKLTVEDDYDIGHAIRTQIIPESVLWFTGEACDDDDDMEGMDEDDEDDEDDDDDAGPGPRGGGRVVATPGGGFASATGGAPGAAGEQPECKQN